MIYFRVALNKIGSHSTSIPFSDLLARTDLQGKDKTIAEDHSRRLPTQPDTTGDIEVLEKVISFCQDTGNGDIDDQQIRTLYYQVGLTGTLQCIAERMNIDVDEVLNVSPNGQGTIDNLQPVKYRSRRFITIRKNGTRVTDGWSIDQVFCAIFKLPLEYRWLALLRAGYIRENMSIKNLVSEFWDFRGEMSNHLPDLIEQSLVINSQYQFNLKDVIDNLKLPETLTEIRRRRGVDLSGQSTLLGLDSRRDMAFRILRALANDHLLALDEVNLSSRQLMIFQQLMQNSGRLGFSRFREFGYISQSKMSEDIIRGLYKVIASLDFSFSKAKETIVSALAENIGFLSAQEKRALVLHYGLEADQPQSIESIARSLDQQHKTVWCHAQNACVKISAHLMDLNGGHFIPLRLLTKQEINDLDREQSFYSVRTSTLYMLLPSGQREVLEAYHLKGETDASDIAEDLGVSVMTVRGRLHRGRRRIAKLYKKLLVETGEL